MEKGNEYNVARQKNRNGPIWIVKKNNAFSVKRNKTSKNSEHDIPFFSQWLGCQNI